MRILGFEISRVQPQQKQMWPLSNTLAGWGGWAPVQEPYSGAWQHHGHHHQPPSIFSNTTVYRCISLIAADIAKMRPRLMEESADGIKQETTSSAFSGLLTQPNGYQNNIQFFEAWLYSKLIWGNTYVLKQRDNRNVVNGLHVLDPQRVRPLVTPSSDENLGDVYYEVRRDDLAGQSIENVTIPQSEIIHDRMNAIYDKLWGLPPIFAAYVPAAQALHILEYSDRFFSNSARPSGILTAPGEIPEATARRIKSEWEQNYSGANVGRMAVAGSGLNFVPIVQSAVDAELVNQLKLSDERVCTAFGVPAFKVGVQPAPAYDNIEALDQQYYSNCLQIHVHQIEALLKSGIELPTNYCVEFDLEDLLRMDTARRVTAYTNLAKSGIISPNEARAQFEYSPVPGGDAPMLQGQYYSLEELAKRAVAPPTPPPQAPQAPVPPNQDAQAAAAAAAQAAKAAEVAIAVFRSEFSRA